MNRRSLLQSALLALAARGLPLPLSDNPRAGAGQKLAARPVAVRRPEIPAGICALRLRQRRCAARRHSAADRDWHVRQLQPCGRWREGYARRQHRDHLRHVADVRTRRSHERIRAPCRGGELSRRFLLGHLSAARRSKVARRRADNARGRDFFVRSVSGNTVRSDPPTIATSPRSKRPAIAKSPSTSTRPATANCRRSSAS